MNQEGGEAGESMMEPGGNPAVLVPATRLRPLSTTVVETADGRVTDGELFVPEEDEDTAVNADYDDGDEANVARQEEGQMVDVDDDAEEVDEVKALADVAVEHPKDDDDDADDDVPLIDLLRAEDETKAEGPTADVDVPSIARRAPRLPVARVRRLLDSSLQFIEPEPLAGDDTTLSARRRTASTYAVRQDAAVAATVAVEDFIADLTREAARLGHRRMGGKDRSSATVTVTYALLVEVAQTVERFNFLTDVLLPEPTAGIGRGQRTLEAALGSAQ